MGSARLRVAATVSMVADLARQVGGDRVEVTGLMGPGVDPHLYKATASDVQTLQRADVILYNGLMLEGKMDELFRNLSRTRKHIYAVTAKIPPGRLLQPEGFAGHPDPHVWFDVELWMICAEAVVEALAAADPAGRADYEKRGGELKQRLAALHAWAKAKAAELPQAQRVLVTSHDAYSYFGRSYGFEVVALQGISTVTEAGLADIAKLVDFVRARRVNAVFVESSVPPQTIERIARDVPVRVGGELFSDALGAPGEVVEGNDVGTYEGMFRYNLGTILAALR
jgi:manganese/zinc/iron transport system substrate-binding protein